MKVKVYEVVVNTGLVLVPTKFSVKTWLVVPPQPSFSSIPQENEFAIPDTGPNFKH
jgi:hypothetical protein